MGYREHFMVRTDRAFDFWATWRIPSGGGYPILQWQEPYAPARSIADLFAGGDGTTGTPWQIASAEQLRNVVVALQGDSGLFNDYFELTASFSMSSRPTPGIGGNTNKFIGSFNGNGHTISGFVITGFDTDYMGLFGYTNGATISDLTVTTVGGSARSYIGTIIGRADNTSMSNLHVLGTNGAGTDTIQTGTNANTIGGLVGYICTIPAIPSEYSDPRLVFLGDHPLTPCPSSDPMSLHAAVLTPLSPRHALSCPPSAPRTIATAILAA